MENSEVVLQKGCVKVPNFDFNALSQVIDTVNGESKIPNPYLNNYILESLFQLMDAQMHPIFHSVWNEFEKNFNPHGRRSNIVLFFSFCSGGRSNAHADVEDVKIFGLYGKTIYIINGNEYIVTQGDLLHIPKNTVHRGIGISPRIIGSYGIW